MSAACCGPTSRWQSLSARSASINTNELLRDFKALLLTVRHWISSQDPVYYPLIKKALERIDGYQLVPCATPNRGPALMPIDDRAATGEGQRVRTQGAKLRRIESSRRSVHRRRWPMSTESRLPTADHVPVPERGRRDSRGSEPDFATSSAEEDPCRRPSGKGSRTSFIGPLLAVRRAWLHGVVGPFASWRYVRTAVTRRLTDRSSDRPSFEQIVLMYFSTEDSDRWRASAIVGFDLPSAISRSTSTSRSLSMRRGDSVCRAR